MAEQQRRQNSFKYVKNVQNSVVLSDATFIGVYENIMRLRGLNDKRSADVFEISKVILKTVKPAICETLFLLFQQMLRSYVFSWNTAKG